MSRNVKRVMAYIYMPLLLSLAGFLLVFLCLSPYIKAAYSVMSIISGNTAQTSIDETIVPDFKLENTDDEAESIP